MAHRNFVDLPKMLIFNSFLLNYQRVFDTPKNGWFETWLRLKLFKLGCPYWFIIIKMAWEDSHFQIYMDISPFSEIENPCWNWDIFQLGYWDIFRYWDIFQFSDMPPDSLFAELDDGKIWTGNPNQFDGKNPWSFRWRFSQQNHSIDPWIDLGISTGNYEFSHWIWGFLVKIFPAKPLHWLIFFIYWE